MANPRLCPKSYRPIPVDPQDRTPSAFDTINRNFGAIEKAFDDLRECTAAKLTLFGGGPGATPTSAPSQLAGPRGFPGFAGEDGEDGYLIPVQPPGIPVVVPVNLSTGDWVKTVTYGTFGNAGGVRNQDFPVPTAGGAPVVWLTDGDGRDEGSTRGNAGPFYPIEWLVSRQFKKIRLEANIISINTGPVTANIVFAFSKNGAYNPNAPGVFLPASFFVNDSSPGNYDTGEIPFDVFPGDTVGIVMHGSIGSGPLAYGSGQIQCTATLTLIPDAFNGSLVITTVGVPGPAGPTGARFPGIDPDEPEFPVMIPGPVGATGNQGRPGISLDPDEPEYPLLIPGQQGAQGTQGASGAQGPRGIPADPDDPDLPMMIPGPQGSQGQTGAQGPRAPSIDPDDPELPAMIPGPSFGPLSGDVVTLGNVATIQANAITTTKILDNAVTSAKILDNAITTTKILDNAVTSAKLRQGVALSVIGVPGNATGNETDIFASAGSGQVLRENGSTIGFGTLATAAYGGNTVTYPKLQAETGNTVLGRGSGGSGTVQELSLSGVVEILSSSINFQKQSSLSWGGLLSGIGTQLLFSSIFLGIGDNAWSTSTVFDQVLNQSTRKQEWGIRIFANTLAGTGSPTFNIHSVVNGTPTSLLASFAASGSVPDGALVTTTASAAAAGWGIRVSVASGTINAGTLGIYVSCRFQE